LIQVYIENQLNRNSGKTTPNGYSLQWTASKTALSELIYALNSQGVFDKGNADIKVIVEELGILETLNELGIGFVAYSPLGRGFITGEIKSIDDLSADDARRSFPRFQRDQFQKNIDLLNEIEKLAIEKEITASQLAIAWVIAQGHLPIPGTKRVKYVEQNI